MIRRHALLTLLFCQALGGVAHAGAQLNFKLDKCNRDTQVANEGTIVKDVDGDTVHVQIEGATYSVRMLGMDTPESHFMGKTQGKWADEAAQTLAELAPVGTPVTLEYGTDACDAHGRLLAHVFVGKMHLNGEMVKRGLAVNYCVAPDFRYCDAFSRYADSAIRRKLGMFSEENFELPYDFRRRIENAPMRSYVGDIDSKEVHGPGHQNEVPIAKRVFFYTKSSVKEPYFVVGGQ